MYIFLISFIFILSKTDLEMSLKVKEEEIILLKEQVKREKEKLQTQFREVASNKDQKHKRELKSLKGEMEREKQHNYAHHVYTCVCYNILL